MKTAFGKRIWSGKGLAVFLLALLLLAPQAFAAPAQPTIELTHTGEDGRVVLECVAKVGAPDGENDTRVEMTLTLQAGSSLTIDPSGVQVIYQTEDGETTALDKDHWTADQGKGLVEASLEVDTDMGGQLLCRVSGQLAAGAKASNSAQIDVAYQDLVTGEKTSQSATARDEVAPPAPVRTGYSVTLDLNGGSLSGKNAAFVWQDDLSAGQKIDLADLPLPSRSGYFFDGWSLSSGAGAKLEKNTLSMGNGDVVLRAVWTSKADKLTLDLNGGSGKLVTVEGVTGEDVTLPDPAAVLYSRAGYKLGGWSTTPDGQNGRIYKGGETFTLTRGDDILYAWWAPQYTLSYDANGGAGQMPRRIFSASDEAVISDNAFTRTGYNFTGWCLSADGRGVLYQSGDTLTLTGDTTLYAQWAKIYEPPVEESGSHLPLLLGILAALIVIGGICGYLIWKQRRDDEDDPYDDDGGYDDGYDDRYDDRDNYEDDRRRDRYERNRYDDRYDDRRDRYDDRRDRNENRRDRYDDRYDTRGRYDQRRDRRDRPRRDDDYDRYD